jgi:hypothetical protein
MVMQLYLSLVTVSFLSLDENKILLGSQSQPYSSIDHLVDFAMDILLLLLINRKNCRVVIERAAD